MFGSLLNRRMILEIGNNLPRGAAELLPTTDANKLGDLLLNPQFSAITPSYIQEAIRLSMSNSLTYLFLIGSIIVALSLIASILIRKVPLKSSEEYHGEMHDESVEIAHSSDEEIMSLTAEVSVNEEDIRS
ncbi:MAG: hypothetical protein GX369_07060 [Euryarchaeota archaeon]|nr:hypothetical protein [Euryarchaeota archaeon]